MIVDYVVRGVNALPPIAHMLALFALCAGLSRLWAADRLNGRSYNDKLFSAVLATAWFVLALVLGTYPK